MGTLYIVATPIGNLKDITLRAVEVLQTVDYIACEDTRRTGQLLDVILRPKVEESRQIKIPKLLSYYEFNEIQRIPQVISLLKQGNNVALVSDSGTPAISDPGFKLIRECAKEHLNISSVPGPSSVLTALTVSGLPTDKFLFVGFPPKKEGHRKNFFTTLLQSNKVTVIMFEAPHRLIKTLEEMQAVFGDIDIVICRELTKIHEEVIREKISEVLFRFQNTSPKGEFVVLWNQ